MIVVVEEPWASARVGGDTVAGTRAEELFGFKELVTTEDDLCSLPSHLAQFRGIDGFYAARLVKH